MGTVYYYFAATLPLLDFNGKLPFSVEEFRQDAQRLMGAKDYQVLEALLSGREAAVHNTVLKQWIVFHRHLQNGLTAHRARRANKDPLTYIRGDYYEDAQIHDLFQELEKAVDPLEAEKVLAETYWHFLDELSVGQYYNMEFIVLYGLKLQILERFHMIRSPKGKEIYEELKKVDFPEGIFQ